MIGENLEWLSHLPSLEFLGLCKTNLTKAIDWLQSIKTAPCLSSLNFVQCQFPPVDFSSLSQKNSSNSLTNIFVSRSKVLPTTFPWLLNLSSNLIDLTVEWGYIKGPLPDNSFENLTSLEKINLMGNKFEGRIPKSLGNLCNLQELNLHSNNFNMTLNDVLEILSGCPKD